MSATAQPALDAPNPPAHEASRFVIFVRLALVLAVITGLEIILVNLPFVTWFLYGALVSLSLVKFLCVIFVFMHLRWDRVFCTLLFLIGLVLALGTVAALLALFQSEASVPLTTPAAPPAVTPPPAPPAATPPASPSAQPAAALPAATPRPLSSNR